MFQNNRGNHYYHQTNLPSCTHDIYQHFSLTDTSLDSSPSSSLPSSPPLSAEPIDNVCTIFVVGFPDDLQEREFRNMFTFSKGFEAASLKWHCKDYQEDQSIVSVANKLQMIGFARFSTRQEAQEAANHLNGKKLDAEKGCILKAEMAKKNLHIKQIPINSVSSHTTKPSSPFASFLLSDSYYTNLASQSDIPDTYESFSPLPSDLLSPEDHNNTNPFISKNARKTSYFGTSLLNTPSYLFDMTPPEEQNNTFTLFRKSSEPEADPYLSTLHLHGDRKNAFPSNDQNPPCNTLYVGNLPVNTNVDELRSLFVKCKGYRRMSFRQKPQGPMCFVEFEDIAFATQTMRCYQGYPLSNSIKGGIRLSFSKNPLFIKPTSVHNFKQMGTALLADL
ncbi:uncharacterized protein B0P05DRAFT_574734 [Gilbertella persicaria]|uniref:uncharacterized protein n=1 Tax=Gilbertella persicaria TaxID=101096 RepID=UPI00221EF2C2|nr:uncharacterized protein B0P05DRAFT_574734 [Gilbertella persicaria]KAI8060669.1 hypothetical protein B0P05DRAFT_574734 [Gilbertella persicaria]